MTELLTGQDIRIAIGADPSIDVIRAAVQTLPFPIITCKSLEDVSKSQPAVIVLDETMLSSGSVQDYRSVANGGVLMASPELSIEAELPVPINSNQETIIRLVNIACELFINRRSAAEAKLIARTVESDLTKLTEISVALSAERDTNKLLTRILDAAQNISMCDAVSLFLLDREPDVPELVFKMTRNDSVETTFYEQRFPVDKKSISGFVAVTGEAVHCEDVYLMGPEQPFRFNPAFDNEAGYRTRSLYCVPMRDNRDNVVGVLQFINRKHDRKEIVTPETIDSVVRDFDEQSRKSLLALASLSAVALQTRTLVDSINNLFENFVRASVTAIEQRDPTTSGHSFRVADLSVALAKALPQARRSDLVRFEVTDARLRELRYASLLHDFGKVGVREHVLVKAKKLTETDFNELRYRLALTRQRLRADAAEKIISLQSAGHADSGKVMEIRSGFELESERLDRFLEIITESNQPSVLASECKTGLAEMSSYLCDSDSGSLIPLLSDQQLNALTIPKGSLTAEERLEIEAHVKHTYDFLKLIPWTEDLAGIPDIAGKHHEKIDGSGYPDGLSAADIPVQSRIMTICDIYDALTASDRPYKAAMPEEIAFRILREDAHKGALDPDLVELFIGADVFRAVQGKEYPKLQSVHAANFFNSVCDPDHHH
jgi:HD-GYP domain-containing protein (c-di-GMP phosphodiesterase class II)